MMSPRGDVFSRDKKGLRTDHWGMLYLRSDWEEFDPCTATQTVITYNSNAINIQFKVMAKFL